ncbi:MAG: dephospho-CoA kinase, partial [Microcella sp.]
VPPPPPPAAVQPGSPGLDAVVARFGAELLDEDGALDRAALGRIVFADEEARRALNGIVHPEVRRLYAAAVADARANDPDAVIVYDVPLLAEARAADEFGTIVVVDAPAVQRIERLVELRGMDRGEAERRVAAQIGDAERRVMADVVIDTSGTLEHTLSQTDELWQRLVAERDGG